LSDDFPQESNAIPEESVSNHYVVVYKEKDDANDF
jgi:hypothetical protein